MESLWVIPYFKLSDNSTVSPFYVYLEFEDVYSDEEYNKRMSDKASLLIALISLSVFSVIIAMNNLKQLLKKEEKVSKK